jgi:class 3 adenylate cyclase
MTTLPSGTVTFVFSDIEASTMLLKRLGDLYGELIAEHRRVVRETFDAYKGVEIDTQGDAFFFAFARARDALMAAIAVQRAHMDRVWPGGENPRVRIGVHTGEPSLGDEGYLGLDVVRAARLCGEGKGGQILMSEATRALVGSSLPDDVSVFPLGERQLQGIDEPERVYELAIEGIDIEESEPPQPTKAEGNLEGRIEEMTKRMTDRINESVLQSLERSLGDLG